MIVIQDRDTATMEVICGQAPLQMSASDFQGHFSYLNLFP